MGCSRVSTFLGTGNTNISTTTRKTMGSWWTLKAHSVRVHINTIVTTKAQLPAPGGLGSGRRARTRRVAGAHHAEMGKRLGHGQNVARATRKRNIGGHGAKQQKAARIIGRPQCFAAVPMYNMQR